MTDHTGLYCFENIPAISFLKSNQQTNAIAQDVSLLIKHCYKSTQQLNKKRTILVIKNSTCAIDLEKWIKIQYQVENYENSNENYEELITDCEIHCLNVISLKQIEACILKVQKTLSEASEHYVLNNSFLIFIVGLDMLWDTESFLLNSKKEKMSLLDELFINIASLYEFNDVKVIISLDEEHNIKAHKSFSMLNFFQKFYTKQENTVLDLELMRKEINKIIYTNNIIMQSQS
ncbi:hypothetical protein QEN19_004357 [Hanseniaspora menglaensis]